jgi:serine/threonine-protein kinase
MDDAIQAGTVLSGKYRVESTIGSGGMGIVVKATQVDLERPVAIKILLSEYRDRPDAVARFFREAKVAARIRGEHVAQVIDVSKTDGGLPYIVMEYLEGEDLAAFIKREGMLPLELAVTFMLHSCSAVGDAHAARVIHRDLKPSNLFLAKQSNAMPVLKVLDFGISRMDDQASHLTHTTASVGTAYYMSPEQIESPKSVDNRVDIWALGCVFHEFLVGETPFAGDAIPQIVSAVLRNVRPKASKLVPGLPETVDSVIDRCLQSDPKLRFQNVGELALALAELTQIPEHRALANQIAGKRTALLALAETSVPDVPGQSDEVTNPIAPSIVLSAPAPLAAGAPEPRRPIPLPVPEVSEGTGGGVSVLSLSALGGVMEEEDEPARKNHKPLALELDLPKHGNTQSVSAPAPAPAPPIAVGLGSAVPAAKPPVPAGKHPPAPVGPAAPARPAVMSTLASAAEGTGPSSSLPVTNEISDEADVVPGRKVMRFLDMGDSSASKSIEVDPSAVRKKTVVKEKGRNPWPIRILITFTVLLLLVLFVAIAGPRIAVSRVKSAAQAAGIGLTYDSPSISLRGWEFPNVQATFNQLPGTTLHASNIRSSWTGNEINVSGVEIESSSDLDAFDRLLRSTAAAMPPSFEVIDIKFKVTPVPAIAIEGTAASFTSRIAGGEGRKNQFLSPRTFVKTERMTLGPFGINLERSSDTSRARIALDPVVHDGPSIIIVRHGGVVHVGADARRAPLARYGIPPTFLGLPEGDNPDVELALDAQFDDRGSVAGSGTIALYGMKVGASAPLDGSVAFHLDGTSQAVRIQSEESKVGPFPARVHGDWSRTTPTHLTLGFQTANVGCGDLVRGRAQKLAGVAGISLADLTKFTGTLGGNGQLSVSFALVVDADIPPKVNVVFTSRDTCGLGIFAR